MNVMECDGCGGTVVYDAEREHARCIFCASVALRPETLDTPPPQPDVAVPFAVRRDRADATYRRWARSSWWYPAELRRLEIGLLPLWIPAWRFDATVEAHWAALRRAPTQSGKQPVSGLDVAARRVWAPASLGLSENELQALAPFDESDAQPWTGDDARTPYEIGATSEEAALGTARRLFASQARLDLSRSRKLTDCRVSVALADVQARSLMLPVLIGSFRYQDRPYRFVINGQTGQITGRAPIDYRKVAIVTAIVLAIVAVWLWYQRELLGLFG
jgi:hypothetical protein